MPAYDPRFDAYISKAQPFAQPILTHLRKVVHDACPEVEETLKWRHPSFLYKGMLCGFAAFKAHATFGFWKHSLLEKQLPKADEKAMGQFGRLTSLDDLPSEKTLTKLVKAAAALNDSGAKVARMNGSTKKPVNPPTYLRRALKKNKKAHETFTKFSPSQKRDYVEWLTEARSDETRDRRLATAIAWMAEGKTRNWKYERA